MNTIVVLLAVRFLLVSSGPSAAVIEQNSSTDNSVPGDSQTDNRLELNLKKEGQKYIDAVRIFADNALKYGKDDYGQKKTPLFVDGLNIDTHEPVKWKFPKGDEWVLVDLGNQQNFFRTLTGLSNLTGEQKYKQSAVEAIRYAYKNLRFGKMLAWGGHMAYNATADSAVFAPDKSMAHELKSHYPFYDLMWEVNPVETKVMIEDIWNSHVLDWRNLDFNRHGYPKAMGALWESKYKEGPVFFWGEGLTFINAGSDLYYAAALLSKFTNDEKPLIWAKRLAHRYVETRNPKTGLSGYQFSQTMAWCDDVGKVLGDRAIYQYGDDFPGHLVVEGTLFPCYGNVPAVRPEMCNLAIADLMGEKGKDFQQWTLENLAAWVRASYRKTDNKFVPMLTDGSSMEGYVCKKDGYFGPKGRVLTAGWAGPEIFWIYSRACEGTNDTLIWNMARNVGLANKYGDIGKSSKDSPVLNLDTDCADYETLFGFLSLYKKTGNQLYLNMADVIGENILGKHFNKGFFVISKEKKYTRFDNIEPLALLHLAAALEGRPESVPVYPGGSGFFASAYDDKGHKYDNEFIYNFDNNDN
jgi:pectate lyase